MQNRELRFIVRVQNEARAALARLRQDLAGVGGAGGQANRGARQAAGGNRALQESAERARKAVEGQKEAILNLADGMKLIAGFLGVRELVAMSDEYVTLKNRLAAVSGSSGEAAVAFEKLWQINRRTLGSMQGTVQIYQRVTQSQKALGVSNSEVLRFVENINNAVRVSGASAMEAEGALIQLAQGLGSGVLQGEELRSVLEQLPYVARIIAEDVGVKTPAALKKMASEGELSSRRVFDAINNNQKEISEAAAKMAPTIGQALTQVREQMMKSVGEIMNGSGIASGIASTLMLVADNFHLIAKAAMIAGVTMATVYVGRGITAAVSAGKTFILTTRAMIVEQYRLNMALGATSRTAAMLGVVMKALQRIPIVALIAGVVALAGAFVELTSAQKVSENSASTMGDVYGVAFKKLANEAKQMGKSIVQSLAKAFGVEIKVDNWREAILGIADTLDQVGGYIGAWTEYMQAYFGRMGASIRVTAVEIYNGIVDNWVNPALRTVTSWVNKIIQLGAAIAGGIAGAISVLPEYFRAIFQNAMAAAASVVQAGMNGIIGALNLIPGIDITPNIDLVAMAGGFAKVPDIAAAAAQGAKNAFAANGDMFDAPQVERLTADAADVYKASGEYLADAWERGMKSGIADFGVRKWWTDVFDEAEQQAQDRADAAAAAKAQFDKDVEDPAAEGKGGKGKKDKKGKDAVDKLREQIADLMKELFPARQRMQEFQEKMALLAKTKMTPSDLEYAKKKLEETYGALSGPIGEFNRDLDDQMKLATLTGEAAEDMAVRLDLTRQAWDDGPIDDNTKALIENAVARDRVRRATEVMTKMQDDFAKKLRALNVDIAALGKGYTDAEIDRIREVEAFRLDMMEQRGIASKPLAEMNEAELKHYAEITRMTDGYAAALDRARAAERAQRGDAMAGLRDGIDQWRDQTSNMYDVMSNLASTTLDGMTDVVTQFVTTGKMGFKDFARSVIASISQIIIKMLLLRAISAFLPAAPNAALAPGIASVMDENVGIFHKGGMGGSPKETRKVPRALFANATRLHSGGMGSTARRAMGLRPGERPAIILENERVLNPDETRAYNAGQAMTGLSMASNGLQGGGDIPQQVVFAPQFNNDFSGVAQRNGLSEDQVKMASKAMEEDMNAFMERWVQREMRSGGRLAARK